MTGQNKNVK